MGPRFYLSACLCFKNAATYLAEWLAFYAVQGVEHFYLCDNDSADDYAAIVAPYVESGRATVIAVPGSGVQQAAYEYCLREYGARSRWMLFCDDDEFLHPAADVPLPDALRSYEAFAGVAVSWLLYGSSGHVLRPPGLVVASYSRRSAAPDPHVKCIVDPARIAGCALIAHEFSCRPGEVIVDERGEPMCGPFRSRPSADVFRLNHYVTKSMTELIHRRAQPQANTGRRSPLSLLQWLDLEAGWNQISDPTARRYIPRIQAHLASPKG